MKKIVLGLCFISLVFACVGCSPEPKTVTPLKVGDMVTVESTLEGQLVDIQFTKSIEPPNPKKSSLYSVRKNKKDDYIFMDLILSLKNLQSSELKLNEIIKLEVKSGEEIYTTTTIAVETKEGDDFARDTMLAAEEQGVVHFGVDIPLTATNFTITMSIGKEFFEMVLDKTVLLEGRSMIELNSPTMIKEAGELTIHSQEYTDKIIPDTTQSVIVMGFEEKDETKTFLHLEGLVSQRAVEKVEDLGSVWVVYEDGQRINGMFVAGHSEEETENAEITHIILDVPKENMEKAAELIIYKNGQYYHYNAGII